LVGDEDANQTYAVPPRSTKWRDTLRFSALRPWVYVEVLPHKSAAQVQGFLRRLLAKTPFKVTK